MEQTGFLLAEACIACLSSNRIMESIDGCLAGRKISEMLKSLLSSLVDNNGSGRI